MKRITTLLIAAAVATAMVSAPVRAEMAQQSTTDKVKTMTKAQWAKLQAEWKKDKAKLTACNAKSKAGKLKGRKRWAAVWNSALPATWWWRAGAPLLGCPKSCAAFMRVPAVFFDCPVRSRGQLPSR